MNTGFLGPAVATVLTACGIETNQVGFHYMCQARVATVLTACGIETLCSETKSFRNPNKVATVLTACGIETSSTESFF